MELYTKNKDPYFWNLEEDFSDLNCGSYALDVLEWYYPYDWDEEYGDDIIQSWEYCGTFKEALEDSTRQHGKNIVSNFDDIRIITSLSQAEANERVILYREGIFCNGNIPDENLTCSLEAGPDFNWEWDFHFIWRDCQDNWHEKMGSQEVQKIDAPDFVKPWVVSKIGLVYQGPIIMFAKKENNYNVA